MPERTVLITGATGFLGRQVVRRFGNTDWIVKSTGYSRADGRSVFKVDLGNPREVEGVLDAVKPQAVIHCAANRFPDDFDKNPDGVRKLNVAATRSLASFCAARGILLLYISTDYVFPGKPGDAPYEPQAEPAPTNFYGQTKLDGEYAVLEEFKKVGKSGLGVILRVPVLYGEAETPSESSINVLVESVRKAQDGANVKMDHWSIRYPTNTEDVARVCYDVAVEYLKAEDSSLLPEVLQFSSEDKFTKYDVCQAFGQIMNLPISAIEANTEGNDPNASVQRPYDCHMSTKALKDLGIDVSTHDFVAWWTQAIGTTSG